MSLRIVSFLGLGNRNVVDASDPQRRLYYEPARHRLEDYVSHEATHLRDVSLAEYGISRFGAGGVSVLALGTKEVRAQWFGEDGAYRRGFEDARLMVPVGFVELPAGATESERWEIFEAVCEALRPEALLLRAPGWPEGQERDAPEEIVIDITHGFRSLPFFAASAVAFVESQARRRKRSEAAPVCRTRIVYAAYEAARPANDEGSVAGGRQERTSAAYEPKRLAKKEGAQVTPVWELSQFLDVLRWDAGIDALMRHGRADDLSALLEETEQRLRRGATDPNAHKAIGPLKQFHRAARSFADGLVTVRIPAIIGELASALHDSASGARSILERDAPPVARQLETLIRWTEPLRAKKVVGEDGVDAALALGRLYVELQRYSELCALLRETLVTAWSLGSRPGDDLLQPRPGNAPFDAQRHEDDRRLAQASHVGEEHATAQIMERLGDLRNDVLHGGFRSNAQRPERIRAALERFVEELSERRADLTKGRRVVRRGSAFVNCSNHPMATWSQEQLDAAKALAPGQIVDLDGGFPQVSPDAGSTEIEALAKEIAERILGLEPAVAHVAGEMALSFALVRLLLKQGVRCVCATTRRIAEERRAGESTERTHVFQFVRWREYGP